MVQENNQSLLWPTVVNGFHTSPSPSPSPPAGPRAPRTPRMPRPFPSPYPQNPMRKQLASKKSEEKKAGDKPAEAQADPELEPFVKSAKFGVPRIGVIHKMNTAGLDGERLIDKVMLLAGKGGAPTGLSNKATLPSITASTEPQHDPVTVLWNGEDLTRFAMMAKYGIKAVSIKNKMKHEKV